MEPTALGTIAACLSGVTMLLRQLRIGLRDRADRKMIARNPSIAPHLIELRRAQVTGLFARQPTGPGGNPATEQESVGKEVKT